MSVRLGIVGLGNQGQRHFEALQGFQLGEFSAVCDVDTNKVSKILAQNPKVKGYSSYQEMISKAKIDLLIIATHAPSHSEIVQFGVERGIPRILCEKPVATSLKDADQTVKFQDEGVRIAVNHSRRWWSPYHRVKALLSSNTLGKLISLRFICGGGRLGGVGCHAFDIFRFLSDSEPCQILGFLDRFQNADPRGIDYQDPGGWGQILFQNGVKASIEMSNELALPPRLEILCSDGRVDIDELGGQWVIQSRSPESRNDPTHRRYSKPLNTETWTVEKLDILNLNRCVVEELISDKAISCDSRDGRASLESIVALHLSHENGGNIIKFPIDGEYRSRQLMIA
jgi:predicted dehydrogenase